VVKLVPGLREVDLTDESAVRRGFGIGVDDAQRVGLAVLAVGAQRDVRASLGRRGGGERRRGIESWIGQKAHRRYLVVEVSD
jgi:hypothetical protein